MRAASGTPAKGKAADAVDTADDLDFVPPSLQKMRDLSSALKSQIDFQGTPPAVIAGAAKKAPAVSKQSGSAARKGAGKAEEHAELYAAAGDSLPALELQIKIEGLQSNIEKMQLDAKKKQDSYLRREAQYKGQIERMKQLLEKAVLCRTSQDFGMDNVKQVHAKIQEEIANSQAKTTRILEEHEKDILRQFRSRLFDVEDKLKKDQSKKDEGTQLTKEWVEKSGQLVQELEKYRDEALRLDRLNEQLSNENLRLKTNAKCQEDDREFLVRQIVALKKENSRLHKDVEKAALSSLKSTLNTSPGPAPAPTAAEAGPGESIAKYKDVVRRLRRLLDAERKNLREVRSEHLNALQSRTELESLMRMCLDDVKQDIMKQRTRSGEDAGATGGGVAAMGREDRMKPPLQVLELLLSQERVISLLYDRALPPRMSFGGFGGIADIVTAEEEQQVKELLEKLPGEGFAESDGWLLEDGNDSASP